MAKGKHIFETILVAVDDSKDAQLAFDYAIKRAKLENSKLYIVSILESDELNIYQALSKDYIHGERKNLEKHIQEYVKEAKKRGVKHVYPIVAEGDPGNTIVQEVIPNLKDKPQVLIIGSLAKTGPRKYLGSQAAYMAKYAPISVLVVR